IAYLNTLHTTVAGQIDHDIKISVLGFSQGAATASRWLMDGSVKADRMILWAGILPFDLDLKQAPDRLGDIEKICVYGTRDPYLSDEKMKEMTDLAGRTNLLFNYKKFDGAHDIDEEMLKELFSDQDSR
ncbi:MAG: phospholipase, partial [Cyclobacteriaceae bacterium]